MEELIKSLWPFFERSGMVAGVIMSIFYVLKARELSDLRERFDKSMDQQVIDAKASIAANILVIEKNTTAIQSQSEMIKEQSEWIRALINPKEGK